jgi:chemotaxis signal transduction protein
VTAVDAELLEQRAAELAVPFEPEDDTDLLDVVTVRVVGGGRYAFETRHVRRVVRNTGLCRLPGAAGKLLGLVLVNGDAVPVMDLAASLGLTQPDRTRAFVLLLDGGHPPLGLLVDEVESSRRLARAELTEVIDEPDGERSVERGITEDGVVLLDVELLLADDHAPAPGSRGRRDNPPPEPGEPCPT